MYIDESGVANLAVYQNRYFVLSSLVVEDHADLELSGYFRSIKRRHELSESRSVHAVDILERKNDPSYLPNAKCKDFTNSLSEFVENASFRIFVYAIDKNLLRKRLGVPNGYKFKGSKRHQEDKEIAYELLSRRALFDFAKVLEGEDALGAIVAESRRGSDHFLLGAYLDSQDSQMFIDLANSPKVRAKNVSKRLVALTQKSKATIHSICFASKSSVKSGLELADVISFCAYNDINRSINKKKNRGVDLMWRRIKKCIETGQVQRLEVKEISGLIPDKIHKIADRIRERMTAYSDLVNPTRR